MNKITKLGASGILYHNGQFLLGLRAKDDPALPGLWCSPGGGVEFQEQIDDAIVREFEEETGLSVKVVPGFLSLQERIHGEKHTLLVFKQVVVDGPGAPRALDGFDKVGWFCCHELARMFKAEQVTPATKAALLAFYAYEENT